MAAENFIKFVNSPDIRKHWQDIGYVPGSLEAAWLIYQNRSTDIIDKFAAWEELIETMPDCEIKTAHGDLYVSLHTFLREYISIQKRLFFLPDHDLSALFSPETNLFKVSYDDTGRNGILTGSEKKLLGTFDNMWFNFPVPFKQGDIVRDPTMRDCGGAFILSKTTADYCKMHPHFRGFDTTYMNASGYFMLDNGFMENRLTNTLMDTEYYKDKLNGKLRALKTFSFLGKSKIGESLLVMLYQITNKFCK